jgi:hypothetical protein
LFGVPSEGRSLPEGIDPSDEGEKGGIGKGRCGKEFFGIFFSFLEKATLRNCSEERGRGFNPPDPDGL